MTKKTVGFTAVAEAQVGGKTLVSQPVPFTLDGASLIADIVRGDAATFRVLSGPARERGVASFEKTFTDPVMFNIYKNGEPIRQVEVRNMFQATTLDLGSKA